MESVFFSFQCWKFNYIVIFTVDRMIKHLLPACYKSHQKKLENVISSGASRREIRRQAPDDISMGAEMAGCVWVEYNQVLYWAGTAIPLLRDFIISSLPSDKQQICWQEKSEKRWEDQTRWLDISFFFVWPKRRWDYFFGLKHHHHHHQVAAEIFFFFFR